MRVKDFLNCVGWKIVVADIDGVLWATDSYWMRPYDGSIVQDALRYWNLDGPGVYDVEAADGDPEFDDDENYASAAPTMAIRPSVQPAYKEESLRACVTRATPERLSLLTTNGEPMLVQSSIGKLSAVYVDGDGSHTWLRRDFLDIVAGAAWPLTPVSRSEPLDGKKAPNDRQIRIGDGFVMPVRPPGTAGA